MTTLDTRRLAQEIKARRRDDTLTIREGAKEAGVSPATLWRAEKGQPVSDFAVVGKICVWLGLPIESVVLDEQGAKSPKVIHHDDDTPTLKAIEAHLRADKDLDETTADFLAKAFRQLYETYPRRSG